MSLQVRLTLFYTLFLALVLIVVATAVYAFTQRSLILSLEDRAERTLEQFRSRNYADIDAQSLPRDALFVLKLYATPPLHWEELASGLAYSTSPFGSGTAFGGVAAFGATQRPVRVLTDDLFKYVGADDLKELFDIGKAYVTFRVQERQYIGFAMRDVIQWRPELSDAPGVNYATASLVAFQFPTETLSNLQRLLLRTMGIAFVIFALGVWLLSSKVLQPVKRVTHAASLVSGQDLTQRVPVPKSKDEIKELALSINHMLDRLEESFDTQRRFTADASHELRTPVTAIVGHANYLIRRTKPSEEQTDSLTVIRREAERMAKLVNDLLELARADAGFAIHREPMNIVEVVEAVHMEIAPVAGNAEIAVNSYSPLIEVDGDAARLKQVVLNLVQNALNAGARHISISLAATKKEVELEILDDGPGIPQEAIPHLFDRFFRVDGARSTRGNGSGLGLAIVKWIVTQHEGSVSVRSRIGEGTVFTVTLPAYRPKSTEVNLLKQTFTAVREPTKAT